jgi:hypothetical protein
VPRPRPPCPVHKTTAPPHENCAPFVRYFSSDKEMGLHRTPPTRTSAHRCGDHKHGHSDGSRESHLGTPTGAGRVDPARSSHRGLHGVADSA